MDGYGSMDGGKDDDEKRKRRRYLIVNPSNGGFVDLFRYGVLGNKSCGAKFLESSSEDIINFELFVKQAWMHSLCLLLLKLIKLFGKPMEWTGYLLEFILNFIALNTHGLDLFDVVFNFLTGNIAIPRRGTEKFISTIGFIDGRIDLDPTDVFGGDGIELEAGNKSLMDLSMMASKLSYENPALIHNVVNKHWKMNFVAFYNGWNDFQDEFSTHAFIFCDKEKDANLILVCFRGTEPFDPDAWMTDIDYTWHDVKKQDVNVDHNKSSSDDDHGDDDDDKQKILGRLHTGFVEAMGLGDRSKKDSFGIRLQLAKSRNLQSSARVLGRSVAAAFDEQDLEMVRMSAYYLIRRDLDKLLREHKNAKFVVTGHSLGGALAILFPTVLVLQNEHDLLDRMLAIHTFGQPRICDTDLMDYVQPKLQNPTPRYYRMVYCNDMVPRLPYDDKIFLYKHFGICLYYDTLFREQIMDEEPNKNDYEVRYLIPKHVTAVWELMRGMLMGTIYGREYKETWTSIGMRITGLAMPGVSAHAPNNYVNSIRLGTKMQANPYMHHIFSS